MNVSKRRKIVILGMMAKHPAAGVVWQTVQYLVGLHRLGFEPWYVEAHGCTPLMFIDADGNGCERVGAFLEGILRRFDLPGRWAFHALHADGRRYGLSERQLDQLYRDAAVLINLHGGTLPLPEHTATRRLVYLETDPVAPQVELFNGVRSTLEFFAQHQAFFTFGENYGRPGCGLPIAERFAFRPTRQPVVCDFWDRPAVAGETWTTIGNWRQHGREIRYRGELYHWSKHLEFEKFLDVPTQTGGTFELALSRSSFGPQDRARLERHGWRVRDALEFSSDLDSYRDYISASRGEFTVAKDQNVRLRSGWFSDRSAAYLAAGRPVITQETGFSDFLPTGRGLFGFSTLGEIAAAIDRINSDYDAHCRAAAQLAREFFGFEAVLGQLTRDLSL